MTETGARREQSGEERTPVIQRRLVVLSTCALLALGPVGAARAAAWRIGRGADVFEPDQAVIATRIGGWFDASYEDNDLPDSSPSVNLNHLNFFLDTRYRETWQLFGEVEFENRAISPGSRASASTRSSSSTCATW